jgi:hypothetical protein
MGCIESQVSEIAQTHAATENGRPPTIVFCRRRGSTDDDAYTAQALAARRDRRVRGCMRRKDLRDRH